MGCLCLRKSAVKDLLEGNHLSPQIVTSYINGSNSLTKWTFEQELESKELIFAKNLENKLVNFFQDYGIEIPKTAWQKDERRGRNTKNTGIAGKIPNNINKNISTRLKGMGWKINRVLYLWFANSNANFYNLLNGTLKFVSKEDYAMLAFFCRCTESRLAIGGGQLGLYSDSTFAPGSIKCDYMLRPIYWEKLEDKEIDDILKKVGIPRYFYNLLLTGELTCPETVLEAIVNCGSKFIKGSSTKDIGMLHSKYKVINNNVISMDDLEELCEAKKEEEKPVNYHDKFKESIDKANTTKSLINRPFIVPVIENESKQRTIANLIKEEPLKYEMFAYLLLDNRDGFSPEELRNLSKICQSLADINELL